MSSNKPFFPNLNGLRFVAALLVIIWHFLDYRFKFGLSTLADKGLVIGLGKHGVTIFFSLSGFLITTLLLNEKKTEGFISLKSFYIRRILRIWPLYFLIVLSCFFLIPHISLLSIPGVNMIERNFWLSLLLFGLILPSFAMHAFGQIPMAIITWSIGVEEIFYLITPLILKYSKHILIGFLIFAIIFLFLGNGFITNPNENKIIGLIILFLADLRLTS